MDLTKYLPKNNDGGKKSGGGRQRYKEYVIDAEEQGKKPLLFDEWYKLQNG